MNIAAWLFAVAFVLAMIANFIVSTVNSNLREENRKLVGRFEGQIRTLAALSSDSPDRIESITIERCDHCAHCKAAS